MSNFLKRVSNYTKNTIDKYPIITTSVVNVVWICTKACTIGFHWFKKTLTISGIDNVLLPKYDKVYYVKNGIHSSKYFHDMILFEFVILKNNNFTTLLRRFEKYSEYELFDKSSCVLSDFKMMGIQIKIKNTTFEQDGCREFVYDVDLFEKKINIVGNVLFDTKFVEYILMTNFGVKLGNEDYVVTFFDDKLQHYEIRKNECIELIDDSNYFVIKTQSI